MSRPKSNLSAAEKQWNLVEKKFSNLKEYVEKHSFKEPDYNKFRTQLNILSFELFCSKFKFKSLAINE